MADTLISVVLEQLTSIIRQRTEHEVRLLVGVEKEAHKLDNNLRGIQAVLEDAEKRQVKEATVKQWLDKLKDVSYDMDDVLDKWNTAMLKKQIMRDENALRSMRKVRSLIFSTCFWCTRVALRRDIAVQIKQLNDRLDVIASEKNKFNFTSTRGVEEIERKITASDIDVSEVHGRDKDKNTILHMLLSESSQGPTLRIISIVGMGGMGKTTLAQLVYNDDTVKAHFQKRIWVCVSDPFDEIRTAKAIIEVLTDDALNLKELDSLFRHIRLSIEGKKFLLVLDDVWTEDYRRFEQLINSLKYGSPASRILVTTRKETVATNMGTTDMFRLGQLSNKECWLLFSQVAFFGKSSKECENLKDIGHGIAKKCEGLPLAAKVLGSLLRFKNTRKEWQNVLNNEVWTLEEAERNLFRPLLLSYYDLSFTMRRCFSYCAIFPKGYTIEKDRLIKLWMAQGYLRATRSLNMEEVGEECFKNLVMRSFIQDVEKNLYGRIICKMHDIVHDFAQFLTENECFVMEVNGSEESGSEFSHVKARHSMMMLAERFSIPTSIFNVKNLHSLIVEWKSLLMISAVLPQVFDQLTCLRSLDLSADRRSRFSVEELPREVGKLIHLRYLNLAYNIRLKELPKTVSDLCNLQSLNLYYCTGLKKLPHGLGNLINLRHLELSKTYSLGFMPRGMGRLSSLRTLDKFVVSSDGNVNEASTLEDLKNLSHLQGYLCIRRLGKVRNVSEARKAQLDNKKHLLSLDLDFVLDFVDEEGEGRMINDEQVIEALQPPPNLEKLSIVRYRGTMFPTWMISLTNLKKVQISQCRNCEFLPPLGKLSSLESLSIGRVKTKGCDFSLYFSAGLWRVKRVGIEFLGIETDDNKNYDNEGPSNRDEAKTSLSPVIAFPNLITLYFRDMKEWEEWDYGIIEKTGTGEKEDITTSIRIMPCLRYLSIEECPKLKGLPDQLLQTTSLQELVIWGCPILKQRYKARTGKDWHKISHIPNIKIGHKDVQKNGRLMSWDQNFEDATHLSDSEESVSCGMKDAD